MIQGGISLLSMTAADAEDPQTLRMVAGAIANLCGNGILFSYFVFSLFCYAFCPHRPKSLWAVCVTRVEIIFVHISGSTFSPEPLH